MKFSHSNNKKAQDQFSPKLNKHFPFCRKKINIKNHFLKIGFWKKEHRKIISCSELAEKNKIKRKKPESVLDFQPNKIQANGKTIRLLA